MNIALVGYGKMGRKVEEVVRARSGIKIQSTIDPFVPEASFKQIDQESLRQVDVAIVFSPPDVVLDTIKMLSSLGKKMVIGTTGWYDKMEEVKGAVEAAETGLIWSGNFSLGVNIFFYLARYGARLMDHFSQYDVYVHEFHHNRKADSPSGTALMLGNIILDSLQRKNAMVTESLQRAIEPQEFHVSSTRGGKIIGTHLVGFDGEADNIELIHTAKGREGFAEGALLAARWIKDKKGFFHIDDMMKEIIQA